MSKRPRRPKDAAGIPLRALQVTDARWRAVLIAARDAIVAIDDDSRITLFNPAAERLFGYTAAEIIGHDVSELMPQPYRGEHADYLERYRRTGEPHAIGRVRLVQGQRRDGGIFPLELSVSEARLGEEVYYTAILRDVSDRLAAQAALDELRRVDQQRGRLADIGAITAKIVHDLGNPLAALSMQAQLLLRRARRGDFQPVAPVQQPAEQIVSTLKRLESLVHEFTDFAREQNLDLRDIEIAAFLGSCVDLWQALSYDRGIALRLDPCAGLPHLHADEVVLRRVLDNLIKNAIEAIAEPPGEVVVSAQVVSPGRIAVSVADSGAGVPDGLDVFRLFETTKADGTGIGLAVARQLVAAHGGIIDHAPHTPRGTVFRVELPLAGPATGKQYGLVD
ncbi:MAG: two-component system sensor histidine kinase NtrB [Candidatus Binatia bacterium]